MSSRDHCAVQPLQRPELALALIGTGRVGSALLDRLVARASSNWALVYLMNSRFGRAPSSGVALASSLDSRRWVESAPADLEQIERRLGQTDALAHVVIDATASPVVARYHDRWLRQGLCVVSANKLGLASQGEAWPVLDLARQDNRYGASATVGAGLPILDTLSRFRLAGEPVTGLRAVLSGSMSWISQQLGEGHCASHCVHQAHRSGLTEPDPREDLAGADVARKLLILARTAGLVLDPDRIRVDSLVPGPMRKLDRAAFFDRIAELDGPVQRILERTPGQGRRLIHSATLAADGSARVGLEWVDSSDSMAGLSGPENRIELQTPSYASHPLAISGPGAGIEVTALALWSDLKRISEYAKSGR